MSIQAVKYTTSDLATTHVAVTYDDAAVAFMDTADPQDHPQRIELHEWIAAGGEITRPGQEPQDLAAYAAGRRWTFEQAGAEWNGLPIHTDDRSQGKYLAELQAIALGVRLDGDFWKFADGEFRPVSNADFPALATAAREHVRSAFVIEGTILAGIAAGEITTRAQIDEAFAPA